MDGGVIEKEGAGAEREIDGISSLRVHWCRQPWTLSHTHSQLIEERILKLCETLGTDKHCAPICHSYTHSSVFVCVCESVCLLASVVWIGAARLDQQANHLPVYNSHHATVRCSQTLLIFLFLFWGGWGSLTTLYIPSLDYSLYFFLLLTCTHTQLGNSENWFNWVGGQVRGNPNNRRHAQKA